MNGSEICPYDSKYCPYEFGCLIALFDKKGNEETIFQHT